MQKHATAETAQNTESRIMTVLVPSPMGYAREQSESRRRRKPKFPSVEAHLAAYTTQTPTCWTIRGYRTGGGGYVQLVHRGRREYAHRLAYEVAHGPIPVGQVILHTCDNPICVNPAHLVAGTQAENVRDSHAKGRFSAWRRTGVRLDGRPAKTRRATSSKSSTSRS